MGDTSSSLFKLHDLSGIFENKEGFDEMLSQLAKMTAKILDAKNCSIMLLSEAEAGEHYLRVCANYGNLSAKALQEKTENGSGIAGHVAATNKALLVENIDVSPFADTARYPGNAKSFISAPISIDSRVIGVINVNDPVKSSPFDEEDLNLMSIITLFAAKSIQVVQLQSLLKSRFAQMALTRESEKTIGDALIDTVQNPDQMAKILAKSFYREMAKAGFGSAQIINAASEIISELSRNLQKHSQRLKRE